MDNIEKKSNTNNVTPRRIRVTQPAILLANGKKKHKAVKIPGKDSGENGFERGLQAKKIVGGTKVKGMLMFYITFEGENNVELIPAFIANVMIPKMVIHFYESRLSWS